MRTILAIAGKDLRQMTRDRAALFFIGVFPLLYALFFGLIMSGMSGGPSKIKVALADLDASEASKALVASLKASPDLSVSDAPSREAALRMVRAGNAVGCVVIPAGYGEKGVFTGTPAVIELGVDPARKAEKGMLTGMVLQAGYERMQDLFTDPSAMDAQIDKALGSIAESPDMPAGLRAALTPFLSSAKDLSKGLAAEAGASPEAAEQAAAGFMPVKIEEITIERKKRGGPSNAFAITFPQAAVWGVMGAAAGFGISLVVERTRGTLVRLRAAPIRRMDVLLGKALACFVTIMFVQGMLLLFARLAFGLRPESPALLVAAMACVGVCFVGLMMLLATLGKTEQSAGGIGWAIMLVLAMLGGAMMPLFLMPSWMQTVGSVSPMKWAILALEGAVWRGFEPAQMATPLGALVAIGVAAFGLGAWLFGRADQG